MKVPARCPRCRKRVSLKHPEFPFCSRRCRLLDLGQWLDGDYRIAGEKATLPDHPDLDSDPDD